MSTRLPIQSARHFAARTASQPSFLRLQRGQSLLTVTQHKPCSPQTMYRIVTTGSRQLSMTRSPRAGIMPGSEDPPEPNVEPTHHISEPTPIEDDEYHTQADRYLDAVVGRAEELQEKREDVDVEYSAGVLSITFPPNGTYVLNKQPANKQIWLSSPITGPKRFDWVIAGEGMQHKEGTATGDWMYLRDGTSLTELLRQELGITVVAEEDQEASIGL